MLTLFLLLCLLPSGNPQAEQQSPLVPEDGYLLPRYPELAARALLNADFEVALEIEQGLIKNVKVLSGQSSLDPSLNFVSCIERAVQEWRFKEESLVWNLKVSFRSFRTDSEDGKPTYYVYRVDGRVDRLDVSGVNGGDFRVPTPPSKITVEYHFPIPELRD